MDFITITIWAACIVAGYFIGEKKNRPALGTILGFFGIIGLVIISLIPAKYPPCPNCGKPKNPIYMCLRCKYNSLSEE